MAHEPRQITFLGREGQTKHYGIATHGPLPSPELAEAARALAEPGAPGFTIAHEGQTAALGARLLVGERERAAPPRLRGAAAAGRRGRAGALTDTGMACVWELEVIDFERRAWLEDVLMDDDVEAYLARALEPVAV